MRYARSLSRLVIAVFALGLLAACSTSTSTEPEPSVAEIPTTTAPLSDLPEGELLSQAKKLYESGVYMVARDSFQALRDGFPLGAYREFAEIKVADTFFMLRDFDEAALQYEELVKNRPASAAAPYLLFQTARSYQLAAKGLGRDVAPLEKSIQYYDLLEQRYSGSMYTSALQFHREEARTLLAEHDQLIISFYRRMNKGEALQARQEAFEKKWSEVELDDPGKMQIELAASRSEPGHDELQPPKLILSQWISTSRSANSADRAMLAHSSDTSTALVKSYSADSATTPSVSEARSARAQVRQIECRDDSQQMVFVHLDQRSDTLAFDAFSTVSPTDGVLSLNLGKQTSATGSFNCFASEDLEITADGWLRLQTSRSAELLTLQHPDRLVLMLQ